MAKKKKSKKKEVEEEVFSIGLNSSLNMAANLILECSEHSSRQEDVALMLEVADKWMELGAMIHNINNGEELEDGEDHHKAVHNFGFANGPEIVEQEVILEEEFEEEDEDE